MIRFVRPFILSAAILLFALPASAQPPMGPGGPGAPGAPGKEACRHDVKVLCPGVQPGGGRLLQCLKVHRDQVSPDCRAFLMAAAAKRRPPQGAPVPPPPAQ